MLDEELFPLDDEGYSALGARQEMAPSDGDTARTGVAACPERTLGVIP